MTCGVDAGGARGASRRAVRGRERAGGRRRGSSGRRERARRGRRPGVPAGGARGRASAVGWAAAGRAPPGAAPGWPAGGSTSVPGLAPASGPSRPPRPEPARALRPEPARDRRARPGSTSGIGRVWSMPTVTLGDPFGGRRHLGEGLGARSRPALVAEPGVVRRAARAISRRSSSARRRWPRLVADPGPDGGTCGMRVVAGSRRAGSGPGQRPDPARRPAAPPAPLSDRRVGRGASGSGGWAVEVIGQNTSEPVSGSVSVSTS